MSFQYSLQKLLDLKDNEKQQKEIAYTEAQKKFEEKATELYHLLKRKEDIEASHSQKMTEGISINQIQQQQNMLSRLKLEIDSRMKETDVAREVMYKRQEDLISTSMEVKKYVRMKEIKKEEFVLEQKRLEMKTMDEISLQIYANR